MAVVRVIHEPVLGCQTIGFDGHSVLRMTQRGATQDEVVEVLRNPDRTGLPTQPNRFRDRKSIGAGRSTWSSSTTRPRSWSSPSSPDGSLGMDAGEPKFGLDVSFNEATGEPVAAYLRVREGAVAVTREVSEGVAFADYGADGRLLGVELLAPCSLGVVDRLGASEGEPVRRFLRGGAPRELIVA